MGNIISKNSITLVMPLVFVLLFAWKVEGETSRSIDKRFKDNGNQTITDTKTGLTWMKEDSYVHMGHWINWFESICSELELPFSLVEDKRDN